MEYVRYNVRYPKNIKYSESQIQLKLAFFYRMKANCIIIVLLMSSMSNAYVVFDLRIQISVS